MGFFFAMNSPIGIFDSGYGGLTVLKSIKEALPQYDYLYLGDNARAPYGTRSFDVVYQYTLQAVNYLFQQNCHLIILACNTASAKALRTIQQQNLPKLFPDRRVLGVLRPTTEEVGNITKSGHVGVLGTTGTVKSDSYKIEINKFFPDVKVTQHSCPMWVPLVENNCFNEAGGQLTGDNIDFLANGFKIQNNDGDINGSYHYIFMAFAERPFVGDGTNPGMAG